MKSCPHCNNKYIADNCDYCPQCGYKFAEKDDIPDLLKNLFGNFNGKEKE